MYRDQGRQTNTCFMISCMMKKCTIQCSVDSYTQQATDQRTVSQMPTCIIGRGLLK